MKSFLPEVLLSLLFLSITYSEVPVKELECYQFFPNQDSERKVICPESEAVCVTGINIDDSSVVFKDCSTIEEVETNCPTMTTVECKTCDSNLCNNKDSVKMLKCNKRQPQNNEFKRLECFKEYAGQENYGDEYVVCAGFDVVCVTGIDKDNSSVLFRNCDTREKVESKCQTMSNVECKTCNSPLCNYGLNKSFSLIDLKKD